MKIISKDILWTIAKLVVVVILLFFLLKDMDFNSLFSKFRTINILPIILYCLLLWPFIVLITAIRQKILFKQLNIDIKLKESFIVAYVATFFNNFLPSGLGGDLYKFYYLKAKYGSENKNLFILLLFDKIIGVLVLFTFGIAAGVLIINNYINFYYLLVIISACILIVLAMFLIGKYNFYKINKYIPQKITDLMNAYKELHLHKIVFKLAFTFLIFNVINIFGYYLFFVAFNTFVNYLILFQTVPIINIVELFPLSINGLGIKETFSVFILGEFNIDKEATLAVTLFARVIVYLITSIGGLLYLLPEFNSKSGLAGKLN